MADPKIPSSGPAVPASVKAAMDSGLRGRYAISAAELKKGGKK